MYAYMYSSLILGRIKTAIRIHGDRENTVPAFPARTSNQDFFFKSHSWGGVQTGSTRHVGHFWPIVPVPDDCEDQEFGVIKTGRGNRSTRRNPAPAPLCPPQIPRDQTRAAVVGGQRHRLSYGAALRTKTSLVLLNGT
jgi:hypothetical protein